MASVSRHEGVTVCTTDLTRRVGIRAVTTTDGKDRESGDGVDHEGRIVGGISWRFFSKQSEEILEQHGTVIEALRVGCMAAV